MKIQTYKLSDKIEQLEIYLKKQIDIINSEFLSKIHKLTDKYQIIKMDQA